MHQARMQARSSSLGRRSYSLVLAAEESRQSLPPGKHLLKLCTSYSASITVPAIQLHTGLQGFPDGLCSRLQSKDALKTSSNIALSTPTHACRLGQ